MLVRNDTYRRQAPRSGKEPGDASTTAALKASEMASRLDCNPVLETIEASGANIIGIGSDSPEAGAERFARTLAAIYSGITAKSYFVDARNFPVAADEAGAGTVPPALDLLHTSARADGGYLEANLAEAAGDRPITSRQIHASLQELVQDGGCAFVLLPPVSEDENRANQSYLAAGAACDSVFLVVLTGVATKSETKYSVHVSRLAGIKLGGIVLNDRNHFARRLLRVASQF